MQIFELTDKCDVLYIKMQKQDSELRSTTYKEEETPGDVAFVCIYAFLNAQSTGLL